MYRLVITVLFFASTGLCSLLGCQSDTKAIEQAVANLELTSSGGLKHPRSVLPIMAFDADEVVGALEQIYLTAPDHDSRTKAAVALAFFSGQPKASALKARMGRLSERMLFDQDRIVVREALDVLFNVGHPSVQDLVTRRLKQPCDKDTLDCIARRLASHGMHSVLRNEISLPPPENGGGEAFENWLNHVRAGLMACRFLAFYDNQLPADFGPMLISLVSKSASLCLDVVTVLAETRPEGSVPAIKEELEKATVPSTRIALEAALLVLESKNPALCEAAVGRLNDAARCCRFARDSWPEVQLRTKWLAFASVYMTDDSLLRGTWSAIGGLHARDKAELLSVVVSEHLVHFSSERASTNRLILFLYALPEDELRQMVRLWPDVRADITQLLTQSAQAALPNQMTRAEMDAVAQKVAEQMK